jgi:hypothetical protein
MLQIARAMPLENTNGDPVMVDNAVSRGAAGGGAASEAEVLEVVGELTDEVEIGEEIDATGFADDVVTNDFGLGTIEALVAPKPSVYSDYYNNFGTFSVYT